MLCVIRPSFVVVEEGRISGKWFFVCASPDALTAGVRGQDAANDDPGKVVRMSW